MCIVLSLVLQDYAMILTNVLGDWSVLQEAENHFAKRRLYKLLIKNPYGDEIYLMPSLWQSPVGLKSTNYFQHINHMFVII